MSRQRRANPFEVTPSNGPPPASRFEDDYDDVDGAGPSGVNLPPQPQPDPSGPEDFDCGSPSEWEVTLDDSDDDRTYHPPRRPVNSFGRYILSDSESESEDEPEMDSDLEDYVRDSTVESVPDSDLPISYRLAVRNAQVNAPGTALFRWRDKTDAHIVRGQFLGVYSLELSWQ